MDEVKKGRPKKADSVKVAEAPKVEPKPKTDPCSKCKYKEEYGWRRCKSCVDFKGDK